MNHQPSLDKYFKSKSSLVTFSPNMGDNVVKKRSSLSLNRMADKVTPIKSSKKSVEDRSPLSSSLEILIDLCNDDDKDFVLPISDARRNSASSQDSLGSETSQSTIVYSLTPQTPQKSPKSLVGKSSQSPSSRSKFYSPTKKRMVMKKSPIKRNLARESFGCGPAINCCDDEAFTNACKGMDDKSIFLLTIINRYLKDESLKQLLDENSQELLMRCLHIVKPGMRIACRLYWCLPGWYKKDKLMSIAGDNIDDPGFLLMMNSLVDSGLMVSAQVAYESTLSFDDCKSLLRLDEIKEICKLLKIKIQSKQGAIEALRGLSRRKSIANYFSGNNIDNSSRILKMMRDKAGLCFKLSELAQSTFHKLHILMYLGMNYSILREKKLEFMLINDKTNAECYPIDKKMAVDNASVVFRNKDEFTRYITAHDLYEYFLSETNLDKKCSTVLQVFNLYKDIGEDEMIRYKSLPLWLRRYTPPHIYVKILEAGIQDLKRNKSRNDYTIAVNILTTLISQTLFRQHKKAIWYNEKSLILHNLLDCEEEAAAVLIEGLQSDLSDEAKDAMRPRALILAKRKNIDLDNGIRQLLLRYGEKERILESQLSGEYFYKNPMDNNTRGKQKFETYSEDGRIVQVAEDYCISQYLSKGQFTHGEHWEGRIVTTIFFLLFWDIIYKPCGVKGIFLTHYQLYPLDMMCESFYINRKNFIEARLLMIKQWSDEKMLQIMRQKWDERPEWELSGIVRSIGWEAIEAVCSCLGAGRVAALARRLAADYSYAHTGFPDLTLWNTRTKQIMFVEVKTDADKPSIKQLQWMNYLQENNIDTGFCYVGFNPTRTKSRPMKK